MAKTTTTPKRRIQVRALVHNDPDNGKSISFRAAIVDGSNSAVHGDGPTEEAAVEALRKAVLADEALRETRAQYPKTLEVAW